MHVLHLNLYFLTVLFLLLHTSEGSIRNVVENGVIAKTIIVDQRGQGNFVSVQKAIDSIPPNNNLWTLVYVKAGIYNEKVVIPQDKPFIVLRGENGRTTIIQWGEAGSSTESSTFILRAENFMAVEISFRNAYNLIIPRGQDGNRILWAPAATLHADKASFYRCGYSGVQDTLTDIQGRHYFNQCYIEGAIDFIWGEGQSKCLINATTAFLKGTAGYITAQGRGSINESSGYVFLFCNIVASGPVYLGRAYRDYSRVILKRTYMPQLIKPEGWGAWNSIGREERTTFAEVACSGPGANMARRVKWEKILPPDELQQLVVIDNFINRDGWIEGQPSIQRS